MNFELAHFLLACFLITYRFLQFFHHIPSQYCFLALIDKAIPCLENVQFDCFFILNKGTIFFIVLQLKTQNKFAIF